MFRINKIVLALLLFATPCWADTVVTDMNDNMERVGLNDALRQYDGRIGILEGAFSSATVLGIANGGTGQSLSPQHTGDIYYDDGSSNAFHRIVPSTADSVFTSHGAGIAPSWVSLTPRTSAGVLAFAPYVGSVDDAAAASQGEVGGTSLVPNAVTGSYRFLQYLNTNAYNAVWTTQFKKISDMSTVTVYCRIWTRNAGGTTQNALFKLDIGGQNNSVTGTNNQFTPEWKNFTVDVSSLTNNTVYTVTASIQHFASGGGAGAGEAYVSDIIGFGS